MHGNTESSTHLILHPSRGADGDGDGDGDGDTDCAGGGVPVALIDGVGEIELESEFEM